MFLHYNYQRYRDSIEPEYSAESALPYTFDNYNVETYRQNTWFRDLNDREPELSRMPERNNADFLLSKKEDQNKNEQYDLNTWTMHQEHRAPEEYFDQNPLLMDPFMPSVELDSYVEIPALPEARKSYESLFDVFDTDKVSHSYASIPPDDSMNFVSINIEPIDIPGYKPELKILELERQIYDLWELAGLNIPSISEETYLADRVEISDLSALTMNLSEYQEEASSNPTYESFLPHSSSLRPAYEFTSALNLEVEISKTTSGDLKEHKDITDHMFSEQESKRKDNCESASDCFLEVLDYLDGNVSNLTKEQAKSISECYGEQIKNIQEAREYMKQRDKGGYKCGGALYERFHHVNFTDEQKEYFKLKDFIWNGEVLDGFKTVNEYTVTDIEGEITIGAIERTKDRQGETKITLNKNTMLAQMYMGLVEQGYTPIMVVQGFIDVDTGKEIVSPYIEAVAEVHGEAKSTLGDRDQYGVKNMGLISFRNGYEPGKGTEPLHEVIVDKGDHIRNAYKTDPARYSVN
jgi:hypothetical protein